MELAFFLRPLERREVQKPLHIQDCVIARGQPCPRRGGLKLALLLPQRVQRPVDLRALLTDLFLIDEILKANIA